MDINDLEKEFQNIRHHLDEDSKGVRDLENFKELYDSFYNSLADTQQAIVKYLKSK
jgi:hypothetical protein